MAISRVSPQQVRHLLGERVFHSPVYRDLAERIRLLVVDGRLSVGVRMPSERDLAETLRLSRSTIAAAYLQLREIGYLRARQGSGHFVALPHRQQVNTQRTSSKPDESGLISLSYASGSAPPGLASIFETAAESLPGLLRGHGYFPDGVEELRVALADWFSGRGLPTAPEQLIITAGALSALNIVARALLAPGDRAVLESPTYPNAIDVIRGAARPVAYPLPVTGWDTADFELTIRQAVPRICYLIADFHNPTGAWMTEDARPEMAAVLQRYRSVPVIDETLVELSLNGEPARTPLGAYLPDAITIGSASKAYWGGLRIGWIRAPRDLVRPLVEARAALDLGSAPYEQLVLTELLTGPNHILLAQRDRLRTQRDHLLAELTALLPDWTANSPSGGLSLWVTLPDEASTRIAVLADSHGLVVTAGPRFFVSGGGERQLRLPYTASTETLTEAVRRLAGLWSEIGQAGSTRRASTTFGLTA